MLLTQNPNGPNKADGNGTSTSPSTGATEKGLMAFAAIAVVSGAVMIVRKREEE